MRRPTGRRGLRWDGGASTVEYAAVIVLVAALAAAIGFVAMPERVKVRTSAAICEIFGGTNCGGGDTTAAQPLPGAPPGTAPGLPVPTDQNAPVDPEAVVDPAVAGLDSNDPDVLNYLNAKTENANADTAVTNAEAAADEVVKQIKDFLLDVVGWTDLQKCISSGDAVACIETLLNIVPWGKVFKLLKKIPGAIKLAKALMKLYETVSGAKKRKEAAEKALKETDDILKTKPKACPISLPGSFDPSTRFRTADLRTEPGPRSFGRFGGIVNLAAPIPCPRQQQIRRDIDNALANGRYEDADNLLDDLQAEADRARDAARQNPTQANKDAANNAQGVTDAARKKVLDIKLDNALRSADDAVLQEGIVAKAVGPSLRKFQQKFGRNGSVGEIDVETNKAIIEVASGGNMHKAKQIGKLLTNRTINPTGKPVILFASNLPQNAIREAEKAGAIVVRNTGELQAALRKLGENIP